MPGSAAPGPGWPLPLPLTCCKTSLLQLVRQLLVERLFGGGLPPTHLGCTPPLPLDEVGHASLGHGGGLGDVVLDGLEEAWRTEEEQEPGGHEDKCARLPGWRNCGGFPWKQTSQDMLVSVLPEHLSSGTVKIRGGGDFGGLGDREG